MMGWSGILGHTLLAVSRQYAEATFSNKIKDNCRLHPSFIHHLREEDRCPSTNSKPGQCPLISLNLYSTLLTAVALERSHYGQSFHILVEALNLASAPSQAWKIPDHNIESVDFSGIDSSSKAGAARYWGNKKRDTWWATRIAFCCRSHELKYSRALEVHGESERGQKKTTQLRRLQLQLFLESQPRGHLPCSQPPSLYSPGVTFCWKLLHLQPPSLLPRLGPVYPVLLQCLVPIWNWPQNDSWPSQSPQDQIVFKTMMVP